MLPPTIVTVGELLVEFVSHKKGCNLRDLTEYSGPYPSGAPAICIDQAARLGASTYVFGTVGDDSFGAALTQRLQSNGVNTSGINRLPDKTTGVAFVSYFEDGSRTFIFHLDGTAADAIEADTIQLPSGPLIMHFSGSSLSNPTLRKAIDQTVKEVLNRGGQISCDPNARAELMQDAEIKTTLIRAVEKSSYLFPSEVDLAFLYPDLTQDEAIKHLIQCGVKTIALTQGEKGSTIFTSGEEPLHLKGYCVEEIDPTGAGDCFCGTFLTMMTNGHSPELSGQYANAAGAIAVTRRGPMEGNSSLDTIKDFIQTNSVTQ